VMQDNLLWILWTCLDWKLSASNSSLRPYLQWVHVHTEMFQPLWFPV